MTTSFEEEILNMLTPKIKSALRQTAAQNRDDLEQELYILILKKIRTDANETPLFFDLIDSA